MAYVIFILIIGACGFLYWKDPKIRAMVNNKLKGQSSEEQLKALTAKADKLEKEANKAEEVKKLKDKISESQSRIREAKRIEPRT